MNQPDFQAKITFLTAEEGGRQTLPFQGYRSDFQYIDERARAWMIWPLFLDEQGNELAKNTPIARSQMANMYVINNRFRETVHAKKIKEGLEFHLVEGSKIVAKGLVTKILNLEKPRDFAK